MSQEDATPDAQLVQQVLAGNSRAFDQLYARYSPRLYRYFYRMLYQDEALAQDKVQDCFVRVVENLPRYDARYAFTTWIYTIAYNLCKNHYRKQGNARKALEVAKNGHAPHTAAEAGGRIDSQVYQDVLQRAIRALKPDLQQLIALRFEQELELKEIGQIMGVPEGTIKSRLHYTLKKLAHVLGPVQSRL